MEIRHEGRRPVVAVSGELDLAGRDLLEALVAHVRDAHPGPVAVDLGQVSFADTHGLEPALRRDVVVVAASTPVVRLLRHLEVPLGPTRQPCPVAGRGARRPRSTGPR
ncbi:STAS domain-containing protein [Blastococcus sp. SYSU D01042]